MEYVNSTIEKMIASDVDALKYKAIKNYMCLLHELQMGKRVNYQSILEIMSLVDIYSELDKKSIYYKQYYINEQYN